MIRKLVILAIIILVAVWFFKKFIAPAVNESQGKVDLLGVSSPTLKVLNKE